MRPTILSCLLLSAACACAGDPKPEVAAVSEQELQRVPRNPAKGFPWTNKPAAQRTKPDATKPDAGALPDMTSGDIIIYATGDFAREVRKQANTKGVIGEKEILTLTRDVEIEHMQTQSVLRGQRIRVVRDLKGGDTELLEAQGKVEVVTPERQGRGEFLAYETEFGAHGEVLKDLYTLEGDRNGGKATLWQGDDRIEAEKFVSDRRMDRFRVQGGPIALVSLKGQGAAPKADAPKSSPVSMVPGLSLASGGRVRLQADGEMDYDGASGRLTITRNVVIEQQNDKGQIAGRMICDRAVIQLSVAPPGQPQARAAMFGGSLRSLECIGRVELVTPAQTVLCDRALLDMPRNLFLMSVENAKDAVRIYIRDTDPATSLPSDTGKVLLAPKSLRVNLETSEFEAGGPQRMESFNNGVPSPRTVKETKPK